MAKNAAGPIRPLGFLSFQCAKHLLLCNLGTRTEINDLKSPHANMKRRGITIIEQYGHDPPVARP